MAIQYNDSTPGGTADADGVFIPIEDLIGVAANEFTVGTANQKESKFVLGALSAIVASLPTTALGIDASKGTIAGTSPSVFSQQFSFVLQFQNSLETKAITPLPVPVSGINQNVGKVSVLDIFPNAAKVDSSDVLSGEGVVIPSGDLDGYFAPAHASLTIGPSSDNRDWLIALINYIYNTIGVRTANYASALVAKTKSDAIASIPSAAYDPTNPTMDLTEAELPNNLFAQTTRGFTIQLALNESAQTFDVRVVTA